MTYTKHKPELGGDRRGSACAVVIGQNGEKLVAVAGGISSGMEAWNPADESVQILTTNFPPGNNDFPKVFYRSVVQKFSVIHPLNNKVIQSVPFGDSFPFYLVFYPVISSSHLAL